MKWVHDSFTDGETEAQRASVSCPSGVRIRQPPSRPPLLPPWDASLAEVSVWFATRLGFRCTSVLPLPGHRCFPGESPSAGVSWQPRLCLVPDSARTGSQGPGLGPGAPGGGERCQGRPHGHLLSALLQGSAPLTELLVTAPTVCVPGSGLQLRAPHLLIRMEWLLSPPPFLLSCLFTYFHFYLEGRETETQIFHPLQQPGAHDSSRSHVGDRDPAL